SFRGTSWDFRDGSGSGTVVDADVVVDPGSLLAGQLLDGAHDLVGGFPARLALGPPVEPAAEVDRLAEADGDLGQARQPATDRLDVLGALQPHRNHRHTGSERQLCDAGTTAIE